MPAPIAQSSTKDDVMLSIIVVNWNTRSLLATCLKSIVDTVRTAPLEVWVVDNASTDGSPQFVREYFPGVRLLENHENIGFARANNQALAASNGRYALLLNSDAQLLPGAADGLVALMQERTNLAAAGAMIVNPDGTFQSGAKDFPNVWNESLLALTASRWLRGGYFPDHGPHARRRDCDWVMGACVILRHSTVNQIGLLDPDYFMYTEETDWCRRARNASWEVCYEPALRVIHYGGASSGQATGAMRSELYKSKLTYFAKHRPLIEYHTLRWVISATAMFKFGAYSAAGWVNQTRRAFYQHKAQSFKQVYETCRS